LKITKRHFIHSSFVLENCLLQISAWRLTILTEINGGFLSNPKTYTGIVSLFFFFFSMAPPVHSRPWPLIQFRNHFSQAVGLLGRVISSSQGRYLNSGQHKHRTNAYTHKISIL
jgi:hypothetical protein